MCLHECQTKPVVNMFSMTSSTISNKKTMSQIQFSVYNGPATIKKETASSSQWWAFLWSFMSAFLKTHSHFDQKNLELSIQATFFKELKVLPECSSPEFPPWSKKQRILTGRNKPIRHIQHCKKLCLKAPCTFVKGVKRFPRNSV